MQDDVRQLERAEHLTSPVRDGGRTRIVPISSLSLRDSPRSAGADAEHVAKLAGSAAALPPILVHWPSLRVIDGVHRVRAAILLRRTEIEAEFFEGSEAEAFVLAVRLNTMHGLPLTLADRRAAAERIIAATPEWSDRVVGGTTGLSPRTVATIRARSNPGIAQSNTRIGADGRVRPISPAAGRIRASRFVRDNPDASLRQIAKEAGISLSTARDVRMRLNRGEDPVARRKPAGPAVVAAEEDSSRLARIGAIVQSMNSDPSLRLTSSGRTLLRWIHLQAGALHSLYGAIDGLPAHCSDPVAKLAQYYAEAWKEINRRLETPPEE